MDDAIVVEFPFDTTLGNMAVPNSLVDVLIEHLGDSHRISIAHIDARGRQKRVNSLEPACMGRTFKADDDDLVGNAIIQIVFEHAMILRRPAPSRVAIRRVVSTPSPQWSPHRAHPRATQGVADRVGDEYTVCMFILGERGPANRRRHRFRYNPSVFEPRLAARYRPSRSSRDRGGPVVVRRPPPIVLDFKSKRSNRS